MGSLPLLCTVTQPNNNKNTLEVFVLLGFLRVKRPTRSVVPTLLQNSQSEIWGTERMWGCSESGTCWETRTDAQRQSSPGRLPRGGLGKDWAEKTEGRPEERTEGALGCCLCRYGPSWKR